MTLTTEERAFLAAIRAAPEDDLPRLVMADWLDEQHQPERAEFIRVQCEKDAIPAPPREPERGEHPDVTLDLLEARQVWRKAWSPRYYELRERERTLFATHAAVWWPGERVRLTERCEECGGSGNGTMFAEGRPVRDCRKCQPSALVVRRGFPAEWWGTMAAWCGGIVTRGIDRIPVGPAVVAKYPLTKVALTDCPVFPSGGNNTYYLGGLGQFPQKYWSRLENLPTQQAVLDAASSFALEWARSMSHVGVAL